MQMLIDNRPFLEENKINAGKKKKIVKQIRYNKKQRAIKQQLFSNPIYQGFQQHQQNNQKYNFGPWIQFSHKRSQIIQDQQKQNPQKQKESYINSLSNSLVLSSLQSQYFVQIKNQLMKKKLQNVSSKHSPEHYQKITRNNSLPELNIKYKIGFYQQQSQKFKKYQVQSIKLASSEQLLPKIQIGKDLQKIKKANRFRSQIKLSNSILKIVYDSPQEISSKSLLKQKVNEAVYNYCYQNSPKVKIVNTHKQIANKNVKRNMLQRIKQGLHKDAYFLKQNNRKANRDRNNVKMMDFLFKKRQ